MMRIEDRADGVTVAREVFGLKVSERFFYWIAPNGTHNMSDGKGRVGAGRDWQAAARDLLARRYDAAIYSDAEEERRARILGSAVTWVIFGVLAVAAAAIAWFTWGPQ